MHVQDTILGLNNYVNDNVMFINVNTCLSIYRCTPIFYSNRNSLLAKLIKEKRPITACRKTTWCSLALKTYWWPTIQKPASFHSPHTNSPAVQSIIQKCKCWSSTSYCSSCPGASTITIILYRIAGFES